MRVRVPILVTLLLASLLLAGCGGGSPAGTTTPSKSAPDAGSQEPAGPDPYAAIPVDGPGEQAALAAVPAALEQGKLMSSGGGLPVPDLEGVDPRFVAYLLRVDVSDDVILFEVHADGEAFALYAYGQPIDPVKLIRTPAEYSQNPNAQPRSDREKAAVEAIRAAAAAALPGETITVSIDGYRFAYMDGDAPLATLEVDVDGSAISFGGS